MAKRKKKRKDLSSSLRKPLAMPKRVEPSRRKKLLDDAVKKEVAES